MTQVQRTTSSLNTNMSIPNLYMSVQNIRNNIGGSEIRASVMQQLISLYNSLVYHTHDVTDYVYSDEQTPSLAITTTETRTTASAQNSNAALVDITNNAGIYSGADCAASVTAQIVRMVNALRSHSHVIADKSTDYNDWAYKWSYSIPGTSTAGNGIPTSYNSANDGSPIWTAAGPGNNSGAVHENFYPSTSTVNLKFACDNSFTVYINGNAVLSGSNWANWYTATVSVNPGVKNEIMAKITDTGQAYGFVGSITDSNGNIIVKTNTGWTSR